MFLLLLFFIIITAIYTTNHPWFVLSKFMEISIGLQSVNPNPDLNFMCAYIEESYKFVLKMSSHW